MNFHKYFEVRRLSFMIEKIDRENPKGNYMSDSAINRNPIIDHF